VHPFLLASSPFVGLDGLWRSSQPLNRSRGKTGHSMMEACHVETGNAGPNAADRDRGGSDADVANAQAVTGPSRFVRAAA
jgi:hypothetical protein